MITLKPYQTAAVDELVESVQKLLAKTDVSNRLCIFQAPTGSGKTVMMAKFIDKLLEKPENTTENDTNICFLWVTVGKGNLQEQSKKALEKVFGTFPRCVLYENEYFGSKKELDNQQVIVINWEKLYNKNSKTGEWKNRLMRDGEFYNFREVLPNTKETGRKIILIIDESHIGGGNEALRTRELRDIINADVTIEVSATPNFTISATDIKKGIADHIQIEPYKVIAEGMIKKQLVFNVGLSNIEGKDEQIAQEILLQAAYNQRLALKNTYEIEGTILNPLVLIQLPNSEAGEIKRQMIEQFLREKDISEDNEKLAVWLSDDKSESLPFINLPNSPVEFLLFKTAIDTGWDCPRASILVKFRETKSVTFEIQTVGRILRMPEQRHYENEMLNSGYIYTNEAQILISADADKNPYNNFKTQISKRKAIYQNLELPSFYHSRVDYGTITQSFYEVLENVLCEALQLETDLNQVGFYAKNLEKAQQYGFDFSITRQNESILKDTKIAISDIESLAGNTISGETSSYKSSDGDILIKLNELIKPYLLGNFGALRDSSSAVRSGFYQWFRKYFDFNCFKNSVAIRVQSIIITEQNSLKFQQLLEKTIAIYKPLREEEMRKKQAESEKYEIWEVPAEDYYSADNELVSTKLNIYDPCFLQITRSQPEKDFENFLENQAEKVLWWYKNGNNGKNYFGIKYTENNETRTFYPDYLVQFQNGKLGIFDTKSGNTAKDATQKANSLQQYIQAQNAEKNSTKLFGGIVVKDKAENWRLNQSLDYQYDRNNFSESWSFLSEVIK